MMSFTMSNNSHTTNVVSSSNHGNIANIKFNVTSDFGGFQIESNGIANFDSWVGISDCPCIVGYKERDTALTKLNAFDLTELVFCLFGRDAVDCEASLDIVDETEIFVGFFNCDDIWNSAYR